MTTAKIMQIISKVFAMRSGNVGYFLVAVCDDLAVPSFDLSIPKSYIKTANAKALKLKTK